MPRILSSAGKWPALLSILGFYFDTPVFILGLNPSPLYFVAAGLVLSVVNTRLSPVEEMNRLPWHQTGRRNWLILASNGMSYLEHWKETFQLLTPTDCGNFSFSSGQRPTLGTCRGTRVTTSSKILWYVKSFLNVLIYLFLYSLFSSNACHGSLPC